MDTLQTRTNSSRVTSRTILSFAPDQEADRPLEQSCYRIELAKLRAREEKAAIARERRAAAARARQAASANEYQFAVPQAQDICASSFHNAVSC